jgi:hypothetical protein
MTDKEIADNVRRGSLLRKKKIFKRKKTKNYFYNSHKPEKPWQVSFTFHPEVGKSKTVWCGNFETEAEARAQVKISRQYFRDLALGKNENL